jgi:hypothetical protein
LVIACAFIAIKYSIATVFLVMFCVTIWLVILGSHS